jgi:hypothetical protein
MTDLSEAIIQGLRRKNLIFTSVTDSHNNLKIHLNLNYSIGLSHAFIIGVAVSLYFLANSGGISNHDKKIARLCVWKHI